LVAWIRSSLRVIALTLCLFLPRGGSGLFTADREQSVERIGGRFRVQFRAKVIEMSGIRTVLHPSEMDTWLGTGVLDAPDMDRPLGTPALRFSDMNPLLVTPLLRPGGADPSLRIPLLLPGDMAPSLGISVNRSGTVFSALCGRNGTGMGFVSRDSLGCAAGGFLHLAVAPSNAWPLAGLFPAVFVKAAFELCS
jgi:hypothetical protein